MDKQEVLATLREYPQSIEEFEEDFLVICQWLSINNITVRNAFGVKFVGDTLWINDKASIDISEVFEFSIREAETYDF